METYRIHAGASLYFVTYSVVSWLPVFVSERTCRILTDSLNFCHAQKALCINAYVIMPTHMHAIVFDRDHEPHRLRQSLDAFRRFTGRALAEDAVRNQPPPIIEVFRHAAGPDRTRRVWQPTRHPVEIRTETFWQQKVDYIHANPVRKGLVRYADDWRFSSAQSYITGDTEANDVALTEIVW